ncbi:MAG: DNA primase [Acidobacteria bacterium]|nr:DNA primase [Acidobacteriota bacterium]
MDIKEQVKAAADIAQIVGEVVRLKPAGPARFKGLCPFHQEKSPSFHVDRGKQFYHCFGCGKGGDVFNFLMEIEGVTFFEALKSLAERYGITIPKRNDFSNAESQERDAVAAIQEIALRHYREALGGEALQYLKKRGVTPAAIDEFALGYAPAGATLTQKLRRDFPPAALAGSGLIIQRDDGSLYDRFRHRVMYPIHNESGKPIAFGGRALGDDEPKYLNSSDTKLYTKKKILYNLHRAKETIRRLDYTIIVEGYMDVIGVVQAGVKNVVATCGTALSELHVQSLRRHAEEVVLLLDADKAGKAAMDRMGPLIDELMRIRVLQLPAGQDPDEFVLQHGVEAFQQRLSRATPYLEWLRDRAVERFPATIEGRMQAYREVIRPALKRVRDKLEQRAHVNSLASYLGVDPKSIFDDLRRDAAAPPRVEAPATPTLTHSEMLLVNGLLDNPAEAPALAARLQAVESWHGFAMRRVIEEMLRMVDAQVSLTFDGLDARLTPHERALLAAAVLADKTNEQISLQQLEACVVSLESIEAEKQVAALRARIRALEKEGRFAEAAELMNQLPSRRNNPPERGKA